MDFDPNRRVGFESAKAYARRVHSGFWQRYITGPNVLDIGYRGGTPNALPVCDGARGIELDYPRYDGLRLPFYDLSQDAVHASHVLEHVPDDIATLREWYRVLKIGGHMLIFVPHLALYERRVTVPPSRFSPEHVRSYSPASLLKAVETALAPNTYRVRHLADNDDGYDYTLPIHEHPVGGLEIECVIQKREAPAWSVEL